MSEPVGPVLEQALGLAEVVVNDQRYVREETLFAAMAENDRLSRENAEKAAVIERSIEYLDSTRACGFWCSGRTGMSGPLDPQLLARVALAYDVRVTAEPVELQLRVMKIGEEFGEAIEALIGMVGWNPRKGVTHSLEDLEDELVDVMITAWMALASVSLDPNTVADERLAYVVKRMETLAAGLGGVTPESRRSDG